MRAMAPAVALPLIINLNLNLKVNPPTGLGVRLSDMYMKDMERGLPLSYLSPRVLPSSSRNYRQELIHIFSVSEAMLLGIAFQLCFSSMLSILVPKIDTKSIKSLLKMD